MYRVKIDQLQAVAESFFGSLKQEQVQWCHIIKRDMRRNKIF